MLTDPAGQSIDVVRAVRDDIGNRVSGLVESLGLVADAPGPPGS